MTDINETVEESTTPAAGSAEPKRSFAERAPTIIAVVLLVIVLIESVLIFRGNGTEHARNDVLTVSRRFLVALTTYNESTLPQQRTQVLALATGRFRGEFDRLTGAAFSSALAQTKADSSGQIVRLAVTSVSGDNATALGLVTVTVTNKDLKTPRVDRNLIELSLVKTTSGWKVDSVTVLGKVG